MMMGKYSNMWNITEKTQNGLKIFKL